MRSGNIGEADAEYYMLERRIKQLHNDLMVRLNDEIGNQQECRFPEIQYIAIDHIGRANALECKNMSDLLLKFECKGLIAVGNYYFLTEIIFKDSRYCIEEVLNAIKETQDEIALLKWKSSRIKSYSDRAETPILSLETGVRLGSIGSSTNLQGETTPGRTASLKFQPRSQQVATVRPHSRKDSYAASPERLDSSTNLQGKTTKVKADLPDFLLIDMKTDTVRHIFTKHNNDSDPPYSSSQCHGDRDASDKAMNNAVSSAPINSLGMALLGGQTMNRLDTVASDADEAATPMGVALSTGLQMEKTQVHTVSPTLEPTDLRTCIVRPHINPHANGCDARYLSCQYHDYADASDKAMNNAVSAAPKHNMGMAFTDGQTRNRLDTVASDAYVAATQVDVALSTDMQMDKTQVHTVSPTLEPIDLRPCIVRPHIKPLENGCDPLHSSSHHYGDTSDTAIDRQIHTVSQTLEPIDLSTCIVRPHIKPLENGCNPLYSSCQYHDFGDTSDKAMDNAVSAAPKDSMGMVFTSGQIRNRVNTVASDAFVAATPMGVALSTGLQMDKTRVHTVSPTLEPIDLRTCIVRPHIKPLENGCDQPYSSSLCHHDGDTSDTAIDRQVHTVSTTLEPIDLSTCIVRPHIKPLENAATSMGVALSTGLQMDKTLVHTVSPTLEPIDLRTCIVRPHIKPIENGCDQPYSSSQCHHDGDTSDTTIDRQVHTVSPRLEPIDLSTCIVRPHIKQLENGCDPRYSSCQCHDYVDTSDKAMDNAVSAAPKDNQGMAFTSGQTRNSIYTVALDAADEGTEASTVVRDDELQKMTDAVNAIGGTWRVVQCNENAVSNTKQPDCDPPYSSSLCHHYGDTSDTAINRQVQTFSTTHEPIDLSTCIDRPHVKPLENGCDPLYSSCQCHDYRDTSDKAMVEALRAAPMDNLGMAFSSGQTRNRIDTVAADAADEAQPRENTKVHLVPPVLQTYDQQMVIVSPVIKKDNTGTEASTVVRDDELQKMTDAVNAIGGTWRVVQCNENAVSNTKQPGFESLRFSSKHPGYGDTSDIAVDKVVSTGPKDSQGIAPSRRKKSTHRDSVASEADVATILEGQASGTGLQMEKIQVHTVSPTLQAIGLRTGIVHPHIRPHKYGCEPPRTSSKHHGYGDTSHIAVDKVISTGPMNSLGLAPPQTKKRTHQDSVASEADMVCFGMASSWGQKKARRDNLEAVEASEEHLVSPSNLHGRKTHPVYLASSVLQPKTAIVSPLIEEITQELNKVMLHETKDCRNGPMQ